MLKNLYRLYEFKTVAHHVTVVVRVRSAIHILRSAPQKGHSKTLQALLTNFT